jgi:hypothetical protein
MRNGGFFAFCVNPTYVAELSRSSAKKAYGEQLRGAPSGCKIAQNDK